MKKIPLIVLFTCLVQLAFAQSSLVIVPDQKSWTEQDAVSIFPGGSLGGNTPDEVSANASSYLKALLPDLKNVNVTLVQTHSINSPHAQYIDFEENFRDRPIFGTSLKISLDKGNNIISVVYKTADVSAWPANLAIPAPDESKIKTAIGACDHFTYRLAWFYDVNSGIPAYEVDCDKNDGTRNEKLVLNTSYEIIYRNDLIKHYKYPDSLVTMYVFYPDPLTSAKVAYGGAYANHGDSDVAALDSQMIPRTTRVSVINDSFFLENSFLRMVDLASPHNTETYSKNNVFHYKRDTSAFRDIMIYYHINNYRTHLKDLGFDSLGKNQIMLDASGSTDDNSSFEHTGNDAKIYFGIGGVPDAEDADVPTHEYTHYLSFAACPGCSESGAERSALDEGTADYFAASNSKAISSFNWEKIYNWDGNAPGWYGRYCDVVDHYPQGLKTGDVHLEGQMWSSALMQIWDSIGRAKTDIIMLETLYGMGKNMNMSQAARLFIKNDSLIFKGADARVMAHYFIRRGFLPESYMGVAPVNEQTGFRIITSYFATENKVLLNFEEPQTGAATLYDITGKAIMQQPITHTSQFELLSPELANGIYILTVNTGGLHKSFKLLH